MSVETALNKLSTEEARAFALDVIDRYESHRDTFDITPERARLVAAADTAESAGDALKVFVVLIDMKDGWMDSIHAFASREAAEKYVAWVDEHSGDATQINEHEVDDRWIPPHIHNVAGQCIDPINGVAL